MNWHSLSPALSLRPGEEAAECHVESSTESHGYLGYLRDDSKFGTPPAQPSFAPEPGRTVHVAVPAVVHRGNVRLRLCVICYVGDAQEPRKFWSENGTAALQLDVPEDTGTISLLLRVQGEGALTVGTPVTHYGVRLGSWREVFPVLPSTRIQLEIDTISTQALMNSALAMIEFQDSDGQPLDPSADLPISVELGNYFYLTTDSRTDISRTAIVVEVPSEASTVSVSGRQWKSRNATTVSGFLRVSVIDGETHDDVFAKNMTWLRSLPAQSPLVVLYTTAPPVGHPTLSLRPNRLAEEYRKLGIEVIFFPFSSIKNEQRLTDTGIVQFSRTELDQVNEVLRTRHGAGNLFICSSFPDIGALTTIDLLKASGWLTMYEVRDEMEEFNRVGYSKWFEPELERQVVQRVDSIATVSPRLAEKMSIISRGTASPVVIQNAAPPALIAKGATLRTPQALASRLDHRVIGYMGHLTDSWFDWDLLITCALANPDLQFEIIGHGLPKNLDLPENITHLGPRTHDEFLDICRRWLVGLIPFQPTPLTYAVDPNKIYEYLAAGLRTVTAPMGSVALCPSTYVYERPEDFPSTLRRAVEEEFSEHELQIINEYVVGAGWENRARTMVSVSGLEGVNC
ncbi:MULTISPECIES: glycosyltransferase family 1 protein [Kocuria]|uniref:glycosyltransferase family 1 protein n=1 Tax=Kocuria TaxID=57493 RepID=UPI00119E7DDE|nr:glycosyltransferase family 1 protein [Kocuria rhizophila]MCT2249970.1 hypothetical protein [Kocuria rhizophila]